MSKRTLTDSQKKTIAGKQHYKCATITNYECPLWNANRDGSFDESGYEIDHITEFSLTQDDNVDNLQALCLSCHRVKTKRFTQKGKKILNVDITDSMIDIQDDSMMDIQDDSPIIDDTPGTISKVKWRIRQNPWKVHRNVFETIKKTKVILSSSYEELNSAKNDTHLKDIIKNSKNDNKFFNLMNINDYVIIFENGNKENTLLVKVTSKAYKKEIHDMKIYSLHYLDDKGRPESKIIEVGLEENSICVSDYDEDSFVCIQNMNTYVRDVEIIGYISKNKAIFQKYFGFQGTIFENKCDCSINVSYDPKPYEIKDKKLILDDICYPTKYKLESPQQFTKEFMNTDTPYKGLLFFHQIGAAKTCADARNDILMDVNIKKYWHLNTGNESHKNHMLKRNIGYIGMGNNIDDYNNRIKKSGTTPHQFNDFKENAKEGDIILLYHNNNGHIAYGTYMGDIFEPKIGKEFAPEWNINHIQKHFHINKWNIIKNPTMKYSRRPTLQEFKNNGENIFNEILQNKESVLQQDL